MILYVKPEYISKLGDCCKVFKTEGETLYEKKILSVIKTLYHERFLDIKNLKNKCGEVLNQNNLNPLYLGHQDILIPIKVRQPLIAKDSCYGYINTAAIEKISNKNIYLSDYGSVHFYDSERIIKRRMKMAKLLRESFKREINFIELGTFSLSSSFGVNEELLLNLINIKSIMENYQLKSPPKLEVYNKKNKSNLLM
jgi:hypothetical protein